MSGKLGSCFWACFWLLFCSFFSFFIAYLIFWLIFLPQDPKFTVTDASLTQFNFNTTNNTLSYNLALNLTIRNPNKKVGIYYRGMQVIANYRKKRFAALTLTNSTLPFYQGHKNTTVLHHLLLQGQEIFVGFGKREISMFNSETAAGVYSIDVKIGIRITARFGKLKTRNFQQDSGKIDCKLKVPLALTSRSSFKSTGCGNVYIFTDPNAG